MPSPTATVLVGGIGKRPFPFLHTLDDVRCVAWPSCIHWCWPFLAFPVLGVCPGNGGSLLSPAPWLTWSWGASCFCNSGTTPRALSPLFKMYHPRTSSRFWMHVRLYWVPVVQTSPYRCWPPLEILGNPLLFRLFADRTPHGKRIKLFWDRVLANGRLVQDNIHVLFLRGVLPAKRRDSNGLFSFSSGGQHLYGDVWRTAIQYNLTCTQNLKGVHGWYILYNGDRAHGLVSHLQKQLTPHNQVNHGPLEGKEPPFPRQTPSQESKERSMSVYTGRSHTWTDTCSTPHIIQSM